MSSRGTDAEGSPDGTQGTQEGHGEPAKGGGQSRTREWDQDGAEAGRLAEDQVRRANWKRWGPYLSERQWGTVREDYSADGAAWDHFPHEHARSRVYRWGEDGLLGITVGWPAARRPVVVGLLLDHGYSS